MNKQKIIAYLKSKKETFKKKYGILNIEFYSIYAKGEVTANIDIFYEKDKLFEWKRLIFNE